MDVPTQTGCTDLPAVLLRFACGFRWTILPFILFSFTESSNEYIFALHGTLTNRSLVSLLTSDTFLIVVYAYFIYISSLQSGTVS
jgi:hypothetical protein